MILEALHDMARPVEALAAARAALAANGAAIVVGERVAAAFTAPGDTVRALADQAGYTRVDVLPVDNDFFRLYRLHP